MWRIFEYVEHGSRYSRVELDVHVEALLQPGQQRHHLLDLLGPMCLQHLVSHLYTLEVVIQSD